MSNTKFKIALVALVATISCVFLTAYAQPKIFIDVGEARVRKSLLAIPEFKNLGTSGDRTGYDIYSIVKNDLDVTGLFTLIKPDAYLEDPSKTGLRPATVVPDGFDFSKWKSIDTEFLIRAGFQVSGSNVILEAYAYYVPQAQLIIGKKYEGPISSVRKLAHTFANDFMKAVTGKPSFFLSQIVVSIDNGPNTHREVYITDWDGSNPKQITFHKNRAISPTWSRDGKYVAYTAFVTKRIGKEPPSTNPDMFVYEVDTGRRWLVSWRKGMNSGAEFLQDSRNLFLTLSMGQSADIYKMSVDGKNLKQITFGPGRAMNVEPALSPDGNTLAFSSDRSGRPMIYTMPASGGTAKRLTFAGHYNSTPTWSPDGKKLAFSGFDKDKNNYDIFLMNSDGTNLIRLTAARKAGGKWSNNEEPSFSPDGRHVLFISDRTGNRQIHLVNIDATNERQITFDRKHYSKPKWGPLIQ